MYSIKALDTPQEVVAWGTILVLVGSLCVIPGSQGGAAVLGIGIILLGLNLARHASGIPVGNGWKPSGSPGNGTQWICRIATNAFIDRMRTASFQQHAHQSWLDEANETVDHEVWIGEGIPSPHRRLLRKERYEYFEKFARNLLPSYRFVVVLAELE